MPAHQGRGLDGAIDRHRSVVYALNGGVGWGCRLVRMPALVLSRWSCYLVRPAHEWYVVDYPDPIQSVP